MAQHKITTKNIPGYAADARLEDRPGVPMEKAVPGGNLRLLKSERQIARVKVFKRVGLDELTPVFGTCQPPSGLSGLMRSVAYEIPESKAGHWGLLLLADRVNVIEGRVADVFSRKPYVGTWLAAGGVGLIGFLAGRKKAKI